MQSSSKAYPELSTNGDEQRSHIESLVSTPTRREHNTSPCRATSDARSPFRYHAPPSLASFNTHDSTGDTGNGSQLPRATPVVTITQVAEPIRLPSFRQLLASISLSPSLLNKEVRSVSKAADESKAQIEAADELKDAMGEYYEALGFPAHNPEWSNNITNILEEGEPITNLPCPSM